MAYIDDEIRRRQGNNTFRSTTPSYTYTDPEIQRKLAMNKALTPKIGINTYGETRPFDNFTGGGYGSIPSGVNELPSDWTPYVDTNELAAKQALGGGGAAKTTGVIPLRGGGLSPQIAAQLAANEAMRRLKLKQFAENNNIDISYLDQAVKQAKVKQADQYNRQLPTVASSFLSRGLASSGVANTGIARFHQDYRTAVSELDTTYAQNRAKLLKQIADAEAEAAQGSANDSLLAGAQNIQDILDILSRYS